MRGTDCEQSGMFSYISAERRVPKDHPLRAVRTMADTALKQLSKGLDALYASSGRPSIPPERLLRALLLQVLYTVRSERLLMEQLDYNFLFRWFVGLSIDDPVWDVTVFTKNRDRLLKGEVAEAFFAAVLAQARQRGLLSDEHFTVDGTLIEAWAGLTVIALRPLFAPSLASAQMNGCGLDVQHPCYVAGWGPQGTVPVANSGQFPLKVLVRNPEESPMPVVVVNRPMPF